MLHLLIILSIALACTIAVELAGHLRLRKLLNRPDAEASWRDRFPDVPFEDIREFLRLFTESFAIDVRHSFKFAPDDQPSAIYRARYVPGLVLDDLMEFESLSDAFAAHYGINLRPVRREDITLAELFALTLQAEAGVEGAPSA